MQVSRMNPPGGAALRQTQKRLWIALALWGMAVLAGTLALMSYSGTPGPSGIAQEHWPTDSGLTLAAEGISIVMFAHPKCPCTRSSIEELSRLFAHVDPGSASLQIVFRVPPGRNLDWAKSGLWRKAQEIPGARIVFDFDGAETRRFGAKTSGYLCAYDAAGQLRFRGGITPARNHEGASAGGYALSSLLTEDIGQEMVSTNVFGCPLFSDDEDCEEPHEQQ